MITYKIEAISTFSSLLFLLQFQLVAMIILKTRLLFIF